MDRDQEVNSQVRMKWTIGASIIVLLAVVVGGYVLWQRGSTHQTISRSSQTITLGVATWIGYGALYIAEDKRFFEGADVTLKRIDDTAVYNSAMLKHDIDGFCNTLDSFALAAAAGVEGRVVYCFDESAGADGLVAKPTIKSVRDLKGRRIAAQTGWPAHFFLLYLMKQEGLGPKEYTHVSLDSDKSGAAFMSGELDAAVTWEPWLSKIQASGEGHLLASSKAHPGIIMDALIIRPDVVSAKPQAVRVLVHGCLRAVDFWRSHPQEGNAIVAKHFGLSPDEVGQMVKGVRFLDKAANTEYLRRDGPAARTLRMASGIWVDAGVIDKAPDFADALVSDFIE